MGEAAPPVETTLRRVVVGYRVVAALWLTLLGAVTLSARPPRPGVVVLTIALALSWSGLTWVISNRRPSLFSSWAWLAADLAVAVLTVLAPRGAGVRAGFFGGYPMSAVFLAAWGRRYQGGLLAAGLLAAAAVARFGGGAELPVENLATATVIYLVSGAVSPWAMEVIVRQDRSRREAEAALVRERAERARAEERADLADHLHDSVLQTLALIQKSADRPEEVAALARRQERELRRWLIQGELASAAPTLAGALRSACTEVEDHYGVRVDLVTVGDCPLDQRLEALVAAGREALTNAAKFAGVDQISAYGEVADEEVLIFVRDRGAGFDPARVPSDRRGLAESIIHRTERHGGKARVRSSPGGGTEVELAMPRMAP